MMNYNPNYNYDSFVLILYATTRTVETPPKNADAAPRNTEVLTIKEEVTLRNAKAAPRNTEVVTIKDVRNERLWLQL